jgi:hypothetical protein
VHFLRVALASCALVFVFACDRMATVKRCRALANDVNEKLDTIEDITKRGTPAGYASASRLYAELARTIDRHFPDAGADAAPDPRGFERSAREYQSHLLAGSRHTASLGQALADGNQATANVEMRSLEDVSRQAKIAVKRIDASCSPE